MTLRLPTRRCMVCRLDKLKGCFRHRTDPICIDCTEDIRTQRRLLAQKYRSEERDLTAGRIDQ